MDDEDSIERKAYLLALEYLDEVGITYKKPRALKAYCAGFARGYAEAQGEIERLRGQLLRITPRPGER